MELQALLLGLEPMTALVIGVGALVLAPAIATVGTLTANSNTGDSIAESGRSVAKAGLVFGLDVLDKTQTFLAETAESFQDLLAEAKTDQAIAKAKAAENSFPHEVTLK